MSQLKKRIYYNPLKAKIKKLPVSILPEKKINLWNDQRGDSEKLRKKLEEVLRQTTGMASLTSRARLLGMYIFLRSISNKQCLNMAEIVLKAVVDGIKETAEKKTWKCQV